MNKLAIAFAIILFAACNNVSNSKTETTTTQTTTTPENAAPKNTNTDIKVWTGTLKSNIPVFVWFTIKDSVLAGELVYLNTKDKKPIKIIGNLLPSMCMFSEFAPDGLITGIWSGKLSANSFTGTWYSSRSDKVHEFNLRPKDTTINKNSAFVPDRLEGTYSYQYPGEGGSGEFAVKQLDAGHLFFSANCVTGAPAHNMAEMDDTLKLVNNVATLSKHDSDYNCEFTVKFFKDFLVIQTKEGAAECQFGHNAGVDGVYIKSSPSFTASKRD